MGTVFNLRQNQRNRSTSLVKAGDTVSTGPQDLLPHFEVPDGKTPEEQLRVLAETGAVAKYGALTPELRERIDKELAVIAKTGYTGYILIVQDFIRFAKERGILTAVRGSEIGRASCRERV